MNPFDQQDDSPPDFITDETLGARRPGDDRPAASFGADDDERPSAPPGGRSAAGGDRRGSRREARRGARHGRGQPRRPFQPPPESTDPEPDAYEVARAIVLRQLAMAPRSRKQLADKLAQRACPPEVAESVLDRMTEVGLIDDVAYAAMLVRSQQATRGLARRALGQELRKKGIDDDLVKDTLDQVDDEDEKDRARALVAKKLRSMHGLDATVQTRRLAGMLARKGYSSSVSWSVIREAVADAPEHQRD